jgi:hypothetical protein
MAAHRLYMRASISCLLLLLGHASSQAPYAGLHKYTVACSNPHAVYTWLQRFLPVGCSGGGYIFDGKQWCDAGHECGYVGRAELLHEQETPDGAGFGLHAVHSLARPEGPLSLSAIETAFDDRLQRPPKRNASIDPFSDFSAVLYSSDGLDRYAEAFRTHGQPFTCISSTTDGGSPVPIFSIVAHVPTTQMVVELVSLRKPTHASCCTWVDDAVPRVPTSVLVDNNASAPTRSGYLLPLMVSKAVSDDAFAATLDYYENGLGATRVMLAHARGVRAASFRLRGATVQLRVISRSDPLPSALSVRELERGKRGAHARFVATPLCGFDKLMDTHFGWDHYSEEEPFLMERFLTYFEDRGFKYHIWGSYAGGTPNVYAEVCPKPARARHTLNPQPL